MKTRLTLFILFTALLSACSSIRHQSPAEQRQAIQAMREEVLTQLFQQKPDVKAQINQAPGYGVFSNANVNIILASFAGGYGVVKNIQTGQYTYMKMGEAGLGLGAGVKDYRIVLIFHTAKALNNFVNHGWVFGGQADASAKASDKGVAVGAESAIDNVTIYQLTESGLSLQATLKASKFWKDEDLN